MAFFYFSFFFLVFFLLLLLLLLLLSSSSLPLSLSLLFFFSFSCSCFTFTLPVSRKEYAPLPGAPEAALRPPPPPRPGSRDSPGHVGSPRKGGKAGLQRGVKGHDEGMSDSRVTTVSLCFSLGMPWVVFFFFFLYHYSW